jgi:hypothetical protein
METKETEPAEPIEPEVVEQTAVARPVLPVTIDELAAAEDGVAIIERGIQVLRTLRRASIALTFPHDFVLFKAEDRITAYLQDVGAQRVWGLWGIDPVDWTDFQRTDDKDTGDFAISISGGGLCKRTGHLVENLTGTRYSYEEFIVKRKLNRLQIEPEVRKAARANLEGNILRTLAGLKSIPVEELDEVWATAGMTWKSSKFCAKGRGFGSADMRAGGADERHGIDPADIPLCDVCQIPLVFRPGKDGKPGFFGCAKWQSHKETKVIVPLSKAREIAERKHANREGQREPGDE